MNNNKIDIILDFSQGKERAFRALYDKYVVALRYFAAKYIDDDQAIDDVVQDAFVVLWENREMFQQEVVMKAYLYKTVRNDCLNLIRHHRIVDKYTERMILEEENSESILDHILESEIFQVLLTVFNELSPACKEVYQMSLDGMSHEEIAQKLGISTNTVKKHKNNANHYMRERLKNVLSFMIYFS